MEGKKVCRCPHHKVMPGLIILLGLIFLLQAINVVSAGFAMVAWPVVVILIGLQKFAEKSHMCKCC